MDETEIIDFVRETVMLTLKIAGPVMVVALVVGVLISLLQALTQIQEMTLTFVPKIVAIFAAIFALFPLMISALGAFTEKIADKIIGMG